MKDVYLIGEIGQNHNGSLFLGQAIIDVVAAVNSRVADFFGSHPVKGFNAVKTTLRDLDYEMSPSSFCQPYDSPNSFGDTYKQHRESLELSYDDHFQLYNYAKRKELDFIITLCAPKCLGVLDLFQPDYIKVASRDLTNLPLLSSIAKTKIPMIISTGMADMLHINVALETIAKVHTDVSILHCNSIYPTPTEKLNLLSISYLKDSFPEFNIGFSDHSIGILAPSIAVSLGATIIEKHITLSRSLKGSDQAGSLGEDGMFRMARDIRLTQKAVGTYSKTDYINSESARAKLERSICASQDLFEGHILTESDFALLSPGTGIPYTRKDCLLGTKLIHNIAKHEQILLSDVSSV
tara:strand:+ start:16990 stop:18045 length:1056 start_codon:yes stop_codon:yes gene_type:complete